MKLCKMCEKQLVIDEISPVMIYYVCPDCNVIWDYKKIEKRLKAAQGEADRRGQGGFNAGRFTAD